MKKKDRKRKRPIRTVGGYFAKREVKGPPPTAFLFPAFPTGEDLDRMIDALAKESRDRPA